MIGKRTPLLALALAFVTHGWVDASDPELQEELRALAWVIGEWELSSESHPATPFNPDYPHFGKYLAYVSDLRAIVKFDGMKVARSKDGTELIASYSYQTVDERIPYPGVVEEISCEWISWNTEKKCLQIRSEVSRRQKGQLLEPPAEEIRYLELDSPDRWLCPDPKPKDYRPKVELQKLDDAEIVKTVVCKYGRASLTLVRKKDTKAGSEGG
ncbi:MAG: hypothetical protein AAF802_01945 [Planctomycetota bacterium]